MHQRCNYRAVFDNRPTHAYTYMCPLNRSLLKWSTEKSIPHVSAAKYHHPCHFHITLHALAGKHIQNNTNNTNFEYCQLNISTDEEKIEVRRITTITPEKSSVLMSLLKSLLTSCSGMAPDAFHSILVCSILLEESHKNKQKRPF